MFVRQALQGKSVILASQSDRGQIHVRPHHAFARCCRGICAIQPDEGPEGNLHAVTRSLEPLSYRQWYHFGRSLGFTNLPLPSWVGMDRIECREKETKVGLGAVQVFSFA